MMHRLALAIAFGFTCAPHQGPGVTIAAAGAMKAVVLELLPQFEKETGHKVVLDNDTAGGLAKRIEGGEAFDVAVITPGVLGDLAKKGKVVADSQIGRANA